MSEHENLPFNDRRHNLPKEPPCVENAKLLSDHGQRIALTEKSVHGMERTMEAVSTKLDLILAQITRVAILEEKHSTQQVDVTRAHSKIEANAEKLERLSEESKAFMNYTRGQNKILWALAGGVTMLAIKVLFFSVSHGMTQ